jgi:hypothetical protein
VRSRRIEGTFVTSPAVQATMRVAALLTSAVLLGACGDPSSPPSPEDRQEADAGSVPDELVLTCSNGDGQTLADDRVRPQPDGVHLVIDNQRDYDPGVAFRFPTGGGGGENAPPGRTTLVLDTGPGVLEVACYPKDPNEEPQYLAATVVDPEGLYIPAELDCAHGAVSGVADYAKEPEGKPDAAAVAREQLEFGLEPGDELRRAGYPDSKNPVFVAVRDGRVLATTTLLRGQRGWYTDSYDACDDFGD